ncbi:D-cysteine desulfhydrase [Pseudarthrobacter sp. AB1]|uniref:D-cysteine desulfhydrase n=1 Tax=Pseudarthrobacter sp. AB1 TaxID=2138309 RepID=UPI00186B5E87|nr:D-cysteine desulfhydrase [Pseudarthrobacter sp. AB1]MBE4720407.1 D-cysteine desulfhydrase [Pseudarthrobacter sp. AB1]
MNLAKIARRRYTAGATPLEFLPNLTKELGGPRIHIKRDDLLGLTSGGNKTRKLEFLMADALAKGADTIITTGAVQSNHCRLTLSAAVKEGLKCRLLIEERVEGSYSEDASGNNFLFRLLGAESITPVPGGTDLMARMQQMAQEVIAEGGTPYIIPGGGSNALGALGYVACAEEILTQSFDTGLDIDHVVCASGSGGTHAGLVAGFHGNQSGIPITGISVRAAKEPQEAKILDLAQKTSLLAGAQLQIPADQVLVRDDFVGPGYSLPTKEMTAAIQLFARTEGILLDPVYTGKTAAGLVGLVQEGAFAKDSDVLFVHTGGSPALYAYPNEALG